MKDQKSPKFKVLITATLLSSTVTLGLVGCSGDKKPNTENKKIESLKNFIKNSTTTSTTFLSESEKKLLKNQSLEELRKTSVKGDFDPASPEYYISERYELILGSDSSFSIPISELSNPDNSDLDVDGFKLITNEANLIVQALTTGNFSKTQTYLDYLNASEEKNTCSDFNILGSGAISLPISGQNWYKAFVIYEAQCPSFPAESGAVEKQKGQVEIFFNINNGQLKPVSSTNLPKS